MAITLRPYPPPPSGLMAIELFLNDNTNFKKVKKNIFSLLGGALPPPPPS